MGEGAVGRTWLGSGRAERAAVVVWRLASAGSALALVAPIMLVGRRPYRLGRLADRLRAVEGMAVIPDALPGQLSWFRVGLLATVVGGIVLPARIRPLHGVVIAATLAAAVLVHRGGDQAEFTSTTGQLTVTVWLLAVALLAAAMPLGVLTGHRRATRVPS